MSATPDHFYERTCLAWKSPIHPGGMRVESDTHFHRTLSNLSQKGQVEELRKSREVLEWHPDPPGVAGLSATLRVSW